jgi:hypothetical protein
MMHDLYYLLAILFLVLILSLAKNYAPPRFQKRRSRRSPAVWPSVPPRSVYPIMPTWKEAPCPIYRTDYADREGNLLESEIMTPQASAWQYSVGQSLVLHSLSYRVEAVLVAEEEGVQRVTLAPCKLCPYCAGIRGDGEAYDRYGCIC